MTDSDAAVHASLELARAECLAEGLIEGLDFHVVGFATSLSSEYYELGHADGVYEVRYFDMGEARVLTRTASAHDARSAFVGKVARLAAGRGHGSAVGRPPERSWTEGLSDDEILAEYDRRNGLT